MTLRLLIATVDFYGITHGLKGVKGQANRQENRQVGYMVAVIETPEQRSEVIIQKVVILEEHQYPKVCDEAEHEVQLSGFTLRILN